MALRVRAVGRVPQIGWGTAAMSAGESSAILAACSAYHWPRPRAGESSILSDSEASGTTHDARATSSSESRRTSHQASSPSVPPLTLALAEPTSLRPEAGTASASRAPDIHHVSPDALPAPNRPRPAATSRRVAGASACSNGPISSLIALPIS